MQGPNLYLDPHHAHLAAQLGQVLGRGLLHPPDGGGRQQRDNVIGRGHVLVTQLGQSQLSILTNSDH